jgi:RNA polymerase sigma factor (TIGR02999 family)
MIAATERSSSHPRAMPAHDIGTAPESGDDPIDPAFAGPVPLDVAFTTAYDELRRLARAIRRSDPGATIDPTALVNEAWLKLAGSPGFASTSPLHVRRIAGRAMRQVLVEAARRRQANKRGGPDAVVVTLDEGLDGAVAPIADVLTLDHALEELAQHQPRQAAMIEARFFAGLSVAETAETLGVSEVTVARDWRVARAWLIDVLRGEQ